jgi:DNA-binding MarR family transcriptional regulator
MIDNQIQKIRQLSQKFAYSSIQMHESIAKKVGFSGTHQKYLAFFLQKGKLTAGELAELTGLTTGAVTGLIDRFEKKGLVHRQSDPVDRRKVYIVPDNSKIIDLLNPFYQEFQDETDNLISSFSTTEREILENFLIKARQLAIQTIEKLK